MKYLLFIVILIGSISCSEKKRYIKPFTKHRDTIIVKYQECTDCLDACIVKGKVSLPDSLKNKYRNSVTDIKLKGDFSFRDFSIDANASYELIGYFNSQVYVHGYGTAIEFFVESYRKVEL